MTASVVPVFTSVQAAPTGVTIKGRYETNVPISVSYQANGDVSIKWELSDNGTDGWKEIAGATEATYSPDTSKSLKWIRAAVTADGVTVYSDARQIKQRYTGKKQGPADGSTATLACDGSVTITTMNADGAIAQSNPDVLFTVDGDEYLLLDTTEDDNSHFLILKRKAIGNHTVSDGGQLMAEVMCWLNDKASLDIYTNGSLKGAFSGKQDYTNNGYRADMESASPVYTAISEKLIRHIDENAIWKQEPKMWEWGNAEITYAGGITIPSVTDYERYITKIGWKDFVDTNTSKYMPFRTGHGNAGAGHETLAYCTDWGLGTVYPRNETSETEAIRPMFFLNKDAFLDSEIAAQMNFNTIGSDVKRAIANSASVSELVNAGYSESDIMPWVETLGELSNVTADGIYETSLPVTIGYTYTGNGLMLKFNTYIADSENGEYTKAATQVGNNKVTIPVSAGGKYIKFSAETPDGIVIETAPHYVNPAWGYDGGINADAGIGNEFDCSDGSKWKMTALDTENKTTPSEYIFSVDGMDFIMLDTTESNASKFFVMSKYIVDGEAVKFTTAGQLMDGMMDFLNSTNGVEGYMPNGNYIGRVDGEGNNIDVIMPDDILSHINYNQVWKVERKMWEDTTERTVTGGIALPAMHEIRQYCEKIGLWDDKTDWWTRTPLGPKSMGGGDTTLYVSGTNFGLVFPGIRPGAAAHVRPVFYLDKSMFTDKVYDLSTFGIAVLSAIRAAYTREELKAAGYSEADLAKYYDVEGELTSAKIKGIYETSLPVKVDFAYSGSNLANIRVNWYQADTADGTYKLIGTVSGDTNDFRIPYSAGGKYIKGEAVCIPTGTAITTEARYVEPIWGPQAAINNSTEVGDSGMIEFKDGSGNVIERYPYNSLHGKMPQTTPAKYTFTYGGKEYILLDTTESDESHYLVMVKTPEIKHAFNAQTSGQTFNDLIGWLNDLDVVNGYADGAATTATVSYKGKGFLSSDNALPKAITDHINQKNNWKVERKMWDDQYERVYEGGIAIPAYKELERYAAKIGVYDAGNVNTWIRTPDGKRGGDGNAVLATGTAQEFAGFFYAMNIKSENYIRPIFYLDKDFFTSVRVENIGDETAALIRNDVAKEDMIASGLYTDSEIEAIYKEHVPVEEDYIKAEYANLAEGGDVIATVKTNITDEVPWTFIVAIYDENGTLLGVNSISETPIPDDSGVFSRDITVSGIAAGSGNHAKLFVWDGAIEDMYPLYPAV